MAEFAWGLFLGLFVAALISLVAQHAAYTNGVTDGFGFAREPWNPGYQEAGDYLKRHMRHRWPELAPLPDDDDAWNDLDR